MQPYRIYHNQCIYSIVDRIFSNFQFSTPTNSIAMSILLHFFLGIYVLVSIGFTLERTYWVISNV